MMRAERRKTNTTGVTRLLFVLLALIVAINSLSVPAMAATNRVVGNPNGAQTPPVHGVNEIPAGAGGETNLTVEIVDTLNRYAVDLVFEPAKLQVSAGEMIWNVNTLQYEFVDSKANSWYENHQIKMTVTNYSDMDILVQGIAVQNYPNCGYTLTDFGSDILDGVYVHDATATQRNPVTGEYIFLLQIPKWETMAKLLSDAKAIDSNGKCTLGTITLRVSPHNN